MTSTATQFVVGQSRGSEEPVTHRIRRFVESSAGHERSEGPACNSMTVRNSIIEGFGRRSVQHIGCSLPDGVARDVLDEVSPVFERKGGRCAGYEDETMMVLLLQLLEESRYALDPEHGRHIGEMNSRVITFECVKERPHEPRYGRVLGPRGVSRGARCVDLHADDCPAPSACAACHHHTAGPGLVTLPLDDQESHESVARGLHGVDQPEVEALRREPRPRHQVVESRLPEPSAVFALRPTNHGLPHCRHHRIDWGGDSEAAAV